MNFIIPISIKKHIINEIKITNFFSQSHLKLIIPQIIKKKKNDNTVKAATPIAPPDLFNE